MVGIWGAGTSKLFGNGVVGVVECCASTLNGQARSKGYGERRILIFEQDVSDVEVEREWKVLVLK